MPAANGADKRSPTVHAQLAEQPQHTQHALAVAVGAFVDELARAGVRHACVCPGSRSTPLAIKLAQHPALRVWMHLDERSASYFALGLARAARQPVVLLATSGTAAANFLPAVVEARLARVPLVVLTADRPHELRDVGAAQTIDQLRLYGEHAKWFIDLPEPEASPEHERLVRTAAGRAVGTALAEPAGPVHLNWPFREPLTPSPTAADWPGRGDRQPYVTSRSGRLAPSPEMVARLDGALAPRGVIVCGPQDDPDVPAAVTRLAARLGYPVLADALSGVRNGPHDRSLVLDSYDAYLRDAATVERLAPDVMLRFGALPTSKPLLQYMERYPDAHHIVVDPGGWRDPTLLAADVLHVDPGMLCDALAAGRAPAEAGWGQTWLAIDAAARDATARMFAGEAELSEGKVFAELARLLPDSPDGATIFAGSSMPVRDLDSFVGASSKTLRCLSNRGANGIDGVVSSAFGASAAGCGGPVVLAIGDVSFYHDMNGLLAARAHQLDLLVVLLNNDGGGIFSFLPQQETASDNFEMLFGTPHGLDFQPFVEGYGGHFVRVRDWHEFESAVCAGLARGGLNVIEVPTHRGRNVEQHRRVWRAVSDALAPLAVSHAAAG